MRMLLIASLLMVALVGCANQPPPDASVMPATPVSVAQAVTPSGSNAHPTAVPKALVVAAKPPARPVQPSPTPQAENTAVTALPPPISGLSPKFGDGRAGQAAAVAG